MEKYESDLDKAFASLRVQGIPVRSTRVTAEGGMEHDVMGYLLTNSQILELKDLGQLNAQGIKQFVANFDPATKAKTASGD